MDLGEQTASSRLAPPAGGVEAGTLVHAARLAAFAFAGGVLYFAATKLSLALRLPEQPAAAIWVPNALLLAALMLLPVRLWLVAFAAAGAAHVAANAGVYPLWRIAWQIAFNLTLTVSVASTIRLVVPGSLPFRSLRSLAAYLVLAVVAIPALLSWLAPNATLALLGLNDALAPWMAWRTSFLSNAVGFLVLVPAIVLAASQGAGWFRRATPMRCTEGAALAVAIFLVATHAFSTTGPSPALLYAPLPLLLWAAVRFGIAGVASALFGVALIAAFKALETRGPFSGIPAADNVFNLQMFLFAIALPLLILAVVMDERARAVEAIRAGEVALRASLAQIRDLAGRLIGAQEAERMRIARDIHDDYGQRLAAIAIGLSRVRHLVGDSAAGLSAEVVRAQDGVAGVAESLRKLSHELHPGVIRHVGLAQALQAHCEEFAERNRVRTRFSVSGEVDSLPDGLDVAFYRVAQEALQNVARHARASHVDVALALGPDSIGLVIADDGCGFVRDAPGARRGLGLLSLEERVRAVGGRLAVTSEPGRGTAVRVAVPLRGS